MFKRLILATHTSYLSKGSGIISNLFNFCFHLFSKKSIQKRAFPCGSDGEEFACNAGDLGLIPGLERSPGKGKRYPLQYSGLENSMGCIVHGVAESDMTEQLSLSLLNNIIAFCPRQELPEFRVSRNSSTWPVWSMGPQWRRDPHPGCLEEVYWCTEGWPWKPCSKPALLICWDCHKKVPRMGVLNHHHWFFS